MPFSLGFWANAAKRALSWTLRNVGLTNYWWAAAYCNLAAGKFFIFGSGSAGSSANYRYSSDGITWTAGTLPTSLNVQSAAASPTRIVINTTAGVAYYSTNGTSWTSTTSVGGGSPFVLWDGTRFWRGDGDSVKRVYYSTTGSSWTSIDLSSVATASYISSMAYDGAGNYMAIHKGFSAPDHYKCSATPTTASNWVSMALPSAATWGAVAYGAGTWVVLQRNSVNYAYSTNFGTTWTAATLPLRTYSVSSGDEYITTLAYIRGRFLYITRDGTNAYLVSSSDGVNWSSQIIKVTSDSIQGAGWAASPDEDIAIILATATNNNRDDYILGV